ncbi:MAG TPA: hypothetical protein PLD88_12185 [Candidatus Berkiella sp.]|nr:hypothetical protein [Candidatus Berkiella sp.]
MKFGPINEPSVTALHAIFDSTEDDIRYYLSYSSFGLKITLNGTSIGVVLERLNESLEKMTSPRIEHHESEYESYNAIKAYFKYLKNELRNMPATVENHPLCLQEKITLVR